MTYPDNLKTLELTDDYLQHEFSSFDNKTHIE